MFNYQQRISTAQDLMRQLGISALLVSAPADLLYLIGYNFHATERLTLVIIPQQGRASIVMPQFEVARLTSTQDFLEVHPWTEVEDPIGIAYEVVDRQTAQASVAVSEQMWAGFLVGMLERFENVRFVNAGQVLTPMRMIKDQDEIAALEHAQHIVDEAFLKLCASPFAGRTELSIQRELTALRQERGLDDCYGGIVGSGPKNSASPHHHTGERVIQKGDAVVMDFGGTYEGYHADITRTVHVGPPSPKYRDVYALVEEAHQAAFKAYQPGASCESVDQAARDVIEKAGFGQYFTHRLGHGIGLDEHEPPYLVNGNKLPMQAGMSFSDEPGIYIGGEFGVRIEDIVALTAAGAHRFNRSTHDLLVVE
jgi:Xaa-Pro aminopeptidase